MTSLEALTATLRGLLLEPEPLAVTVGLYLLAYVFLVAGLSKLRAPAGFAQAVVDFGIRRQPSIPLAIAVGLTETALALALVAPPIADAATLFAAVLLLGFFGLIARTLRRGESFVCSCFRAGEAPISVRTLARNAVFVVLAAVVATWSVQVQSAFSLTASTLAACFIAAAIIASVQLLLQMPALLGSNLSWARGYRSITASDA